jgi:hypothetical protein
MKPAFSILLAVLLLATAGGLRGDEPVVPPGPAKFGQGTSVAGLPDFLSLYDVDRNGLLSAEESDVLRRDRSRPVRFRDRWDSDGDGKISDAEREAARAVIRLAIEQQRRKRFAEVDTDGNRFLSRAEFEAITAVQNSDALAPGNAAKLFDLIDRLPKDDRISVEEFLAALDPPEEPRRPADPVEPRPAPGS